MNGHELSSEFRVCQSPTTVRMIEYENRTFQKFQETLKND